MKKLHCGNRKEFVDKMTAGFKKITRDNIGDLEILDSNDINLLKKLKELKSSLTVKEGWQEKRLERIAKNSSLLFGPGFKIPESLSNLDKLRNSEIKTNQMIDLFNLIINFYNDCHDPSELSKSIKEFFDIDDSSKITESIYFEDNLFINLDDLLSKLSELLFVLGMEFFEESEIVFKLLYLVNEDRFVVHNYLTKPIKKDIVVENESKSFKINSCLDLADFRIALNDCFAVEENMRNAIVFNDSKNYLKETLDLLYDQFKVGFDVFLSNLFNKIMKEENGNGFKFIDFYFMKTSSHLCSDENLLAVLKSSDTILSRLLNGSEGNDNEVARLNRLALKAKR